jgi:hypothetical protein
MKDLVDGRNAGLNDQSQAGIFGLALSFVYGLTNSGQKPERQQYTDTDKEFERCRPIINGRSHEHASDARSDPERLQPARKQK